MLVNTKKTLPWTLKTHNFKHLYYISKPSCSCSHVLGIKVCICHTSPYIMLDFFLVPLVFK